MNKHIIIAGCARCGKTTLSMKLSKLGLVHYKMDSIKRGIDHNFWEGYQDDWHKVSPYMAKLINQLFSDYNTDIVKNKEYYIIDTCHLYPSDINKYNLDNVIIIFLGHADTSIEKKLREVRKYDYDVWSNNLSDDEMRWGIETGIQYSIEARNECNKLNIKYFDVSYNFKKVLNEAYKYILSELKK